MLAGLGALACRPPPPRPLQGGIVGAEEAKRGHAAGAPRSTAPAERVDVAIVGAGIAGLCASWRLAQAGFTGTVAHLELGDAVGGTAQGDAFPWGAHYVTLPNPGARHYRALLAAFGVITSFDADGRPRFADAMVCNAPQERLFDGTRWVEGLAPDVMTPDDVAQVKAFDAACDGWSTRLGADGRRAFDIPVIHASEDPEIRALAGLSFRDWLDAQGFVGTAVRWLTRYATRDDFGAEPEHVSAWAGLHYHAARRPDPAVRDLGTNVLTWPEGNGWLVRKLASGLRWPVSTAAVVRGLEVGDDRVRLQVDHGGVVRELHAAHVVAAIPSRVVARWLPVDVVPDLAPWRIATLHVDALPSSRGLAFGWDSVQLGARGLGYVNNVHQTAAFRGPAVLTYYDPLSTVAPADGRRALLGARWEDEVDAVLSDLAPGHPDLRSVLTRVDVRHWGHGTAIPAVGLHARADWHTERPHPRVHLAHTDRSGVSLFEEASWHGIHAAEQVLAELGSPVLPAERLTTLPEPG